LYVPHSTRVTRYVTVTVDYATAAFELRFALPYTFYYTGVVTVHRFAFTCRLHYVAEFALRYHVPRLYVYCMPVLIAIVTVLITTYLRLITYVTPLPVGLRYYYRFIRYVYTFADCSGDVTIGVTFSFSFLLIIRLFYTPALLAFRRDYVACTVHILFVVPRRYICCLPCVVTLLTFCCDVTRGYPDVAYPLMLSFRRLRYAFVAFVAVYCRCYVIVRPIPLLPTLRCLLTVSTFVGYYIVTILFPLRIRCYRRCYVVVLRLPEPFTVYLDVTPVTCCSRYVVPLYLHCPTVWFTITCVCTVSLPVVATARLFRCRLF